MEKTQVSCDLQKEEYKNGIQTKHSESSSYNFQVDNSS